MPEIKLHGKTASYRNCDWQLAALPMPENYFAHIACTITAEHIQCDRVAADELLNEFLHI
jgi:hypothetical protein